MITFMPQYEISTMPDHTLDWVHFLPFLHEQYPQTSIMAQGKRIWRAGLSTQSSEIALTEHRKPVFQATPVRDINIDILYSYFQKAQEGKRAAQPKPAELGEAAWNLFGRIIDLHYTHEHDHPVEPPLVAWTDIPRNQLPGAQYRHQSSHTSSLRR